MEPPLPRLSLRRSKRQQEQPDQSRTQKGKQLGGAAHLFGFPTYVDGADRLLDDIVLFYSGLILIHSF